MHKFEKLNPDISVTILAYEIDEDGDEDDDDEGRRKRQRAKNRTYSFRKEPIHIR
jgi:hypothetical protein